MNHVSENPAATEPIQARSASEGLHVRTASESLCHVRPFQLHRDSRGRLVLIDEQGQEHVGVEPARSFPLSDPERWISILDNHGHELTCIPDLADLPAHERNLIAQELSDREFLPQIQQVLRVAMSKEPHEWHVLTDRGAVRFLMRDDDIRRLSPTRAILVDMHGVRYYIADSRQLDPKSRRILSQYL